MGKREMSPIVGARITLRLLREEDLATTLSWRNDERNRAWFTSSAPIPPDRHHAWFRSYLDRDDDFVWVIERHQPPELIGQFSLYNVEWERHRAECGRLLIGKLAVRGLRFAEEAVRLCLRHAVESMGLTEVYCLIKRDNRSSLAVARLTGFRQESDDGQMVRLVYRAEGRSMSCAKKT